MSDTAMELICEVVNVILQFTADYIRTSCSVWRALVLTRVFATNGLNAYVSQHRKCAVMQLCRLLLYSKSEGDLY